MTFDRKKRRNGGSWDRVQFLSIPLRTQRHTRPFPAPHSSNQIKFLARSQLILYLENVLGAEHKHVTVRKPKGPMLTKKTHVPPPNTPHTPVICISVFASTRRAASYHGPGLSLNFSSSVAGPSWKTQSCASVERPLGSMALLVENQRLEFFFQRGLR